MKMVNPERISEQCQKYHFEDEDTQDDENDEDLDQKKILEDEF